MQNTKNDPARPTRSMKAGRRMASSLVLAFTLMFPCFQVARAQTDGSVLPFPPAPLASGETGADAKRSVRRDTQLARRVAVDGKSYDLCVIEGTPGGVACAVRAAREGLNVLLVNRTPHLGGILSSGLGVWDTVWEGKRSTIYDELRQGIFSHYRSNYGETSTQYRHALPGKSGHTNGTFEPRVVEALITRMVEREPNITVLTGHVPDSVMRRGRTIESMTLREFRGKMTVTVRARAFADCTYQGDVFTSTKGHHLLEVEVTDQYGRISRRRVPLLCRSSVPS